MVQIPEPSKEEIFSLREDVSKKIDDGNLNSHIDTDCYEKFKKDDYYASRFLMHHDNNQKPAIEMVVETLKWRKANSVKDITEDSLDTSLLEKKLLNIHNRDIDGCKMLIFSVKNYFKDQVDAERVRKLLIYFIERIEREENGKWITIFFDMKDTGFKNMDMDFIQYFINLFKWYYPYILNYIIVLEMPWLLNALWKIIKSWLPPKSIDKIKFVDKKTLLSFVPEEQCLVAWGGPDEYDYVFEAEERKQLNQLNGDFNGKKVHFVEKFASMKRELSETDIEQRNKVIDYLKFQVEPCDELLFEDNQMGSVSFLTLKNISSDLRFAFKIKTTSPERYKVRPTVGSMRPRSELSVTVTMNSRVPSSALVKDKFLILALPSPQQNITQHVFSELQKSANKLDLTEVRLRVGLSNNSDILDTSLNSSRSSKENSPLSNTSSPKMEHLMTRLSKIEDQIKFIRRLLYIIIFFLIGAVTFVTTNQVSSNIPHRTVSLPTGPPNRPEL